MSEWITWETCPNCERPAAVGWVGDKPIEFDCPSGCRPSSERVDAFADRRRSPVEGLTRP